mmetsp:Transcript_7836/g.10018  ORF Transcript_7836/g.10018 Transcript_7836/m.10018 type:complete len:191 (-) Transcript_7836:176-748(-)|eukprot:CAMPEP_0116052360 /NCGR_PEP_ID=MMETSP0322-20121206/1531_1 /TAXON_ID=163516 /ORGANISM="Leptocylindrus danicus var. apora, Strain B651" /LENGTH=190 /DNA_ID=CAMNT_0003535289 /DNA_START=74 /DNA_END=646 /DNA_ORIENTATION=+
MSTNVSKSEKGKTKIYPLDCVFGIKSDKNPNLNNSQHSLENVFCAPPNPIISSIKHTINSEKRVSFGILYIHEHRVTLGDNPSVSCGPPICLSCKTGRSTTLSIDDFDNLRSGSYNRRKDSELLIPAITRERILRNAGVKRTEIFDVMSEIAMIRNKQEKNLQKFQRQKKIASRIQAVGNLWKRTRQECI